MQKEEQEVVVIGERPPDEEFEHLEKHKDEEVQEELQSPLVGETSERLVKFNQKIMRDQLNNDVL